MEFHTMTNHTSTKKLMGKVALVIEGSRGIGAAIAKRLAKAGASVAITYFGAQHKAGKVVETIEAAGGRALALRADSADAEAVKYAIAETVKTFGRLDVLVNNAGVAIVAPLGQLSVDDFDRMVAASLTIDDGYAA
jgi:3-oxoacyl-[acyl-carrier protein] reductase